MFFVLLLGEFFHIKRGVISIRISSERIGQFGSIGGVRLFDLEEPNAFFTDAKHDLAIPEAAIDANRLRRQAFIGSIQENTSLADFEHLVLKDDGAAL